MEELSQQIRMDSINDIKSQLKKEIDKYTQTLSRYRKAYNIFNTISITSGSLAGASSIVTTATLPNPLISLPTAAISAVLGSITLVTGLWNRILLKKLTKYEQIISTAQAKLNSIRDKLSQSLDDNNISAEEYNLCLSEYNNYTKLKQDIKRKFMIKNLKLKSKSNNNETEHL